MTIRTRFLADDDFPEAWGVCRAELSQDSDAGAGGDPGASPAPDDPPATPADGDNADGAAAAPTEPPTRPEWLPERFWNKDDNTPNFENLAKSYGELETKLQTKTEDLRASIRGEMLEARPETADGYVLGVGDEVKALLPEGSEWQWEEGDPMLSWWRETCFNAGFDQERFQQGLDLYARMQLDALPNPDVEKAKLGDDADERIAKVDRFLAATLKEALGEEQKEKAAQLYDALSDIVVSGEGIMALEAIIGHMRSQALVPAPSGEGAASSDSWEDVNRREQDDRYRGNAQGQRDQAFIAETNAMKERLRKAGVKRPKPVLGRS